jgi:membrane-associated phospholipid phosphatase
VVALSIRYGRGLIPHERAIATIALSFYISFVFFITYPVTGPYHVWTVDAPEMYGYVMPKITQYLVNQGSSIGTAFPSSHVSVSVSCWIMAMRYHRPVAIVYLFLVPALALGAVYGGYHYLIDILAGAMLGILVGTLGHGLAARVSRGAWGIS